MTNPAAESSGDYGYDMAHEQTGGAPAPDDTEQQRRVTASHGGTSDRGEDYGYDEAHGF